MNENDRIEILKDILFTDDREYIDKIAHRIDQLEKAVDDSERITSEVKPIVKQEINDFKESVPTTLGPAITAALKEQIKNHTNEVVDVLFPILGKMIKKYVAQEMRLLSEKINGQLSFGRKIKSFFGGAKEQDIILSQLSSAKIEQVLLIEKESGLLTASYSRAETIDEEMISGMLTAIKNFVEDAFGQKNQNLEHIEYELYQIHLQSFVTYYIAVVISGNYSLQSKNKVQDIIFDFYEDFIAMKRNKLFTPENINRELALSFENARI